MKIEYIYKLNHLTLSHGAALLSSIESENASYKMCAVSKRIYHVWRAKSIIFAIRILWDAKANFNTLEIYLSLSPQRLQSISTQIQG